MILSEDRQSYWAHVVTDSIWHDDLVDYTDEDLALRLAKKAIVAFVQEGQKMDADVRDKISKLKRNVVEGSPEWDIMYGKYFEEERKKRGGR